MPAPAPPIGIAVTRTLREFGERIRAERKRLKLSSVTTAEAAGMSASRRASRRSRSVRT